ncbi:NUDIX hydrolase [Nocardioides aurantiacus]|uniref:NUDIX hydrolase n=1 Tax=Nocardioides aurantiacus TaxID=86796 RepID=UPI00403FB3C9
MAALIPPRSSSRSSASAAGPAQPPEASGPDVVAAGAVVVRKGPAGREVLLVHRPKYDDWSFPKGKQDPGEHVTTTAVREVLEETGVEVRLGRPLLPQLYAVSGGRAKKVHYWVGHVVGDDDVSGYEVNAEVDRLGWHPLDEAAQRLTYLDDLHLLEQLREQPRPTSALVVVRHAKATKRRDWDGPDPRRPLLDVGEQQALDLARVLAAYGVSRVHSSSSTRCTETLRPYAEEQVLPLEELDELSEERADSEAAATLLHTLAAAPESSVVCSHRPVLPSLLAVLGVEEEPLSPSELVVCHHRRGELVATERHLPSQLG